MYGDALGIAVAVAAAAGWGFIAVTAYWVLMRKSSEASLRQSKDTKFPPPNSTQPLPPPAPQREGSDVVSFRSETFNSMFSTDRVSDVTWQSEIELA